MNDPTDVDAARGYATRLACSLWGKHYREEAPDWRPCDNLMGVLTQIDNMTTGLMKRPDGVASAFPRPDTWRTDTSETRAAGIPGTSNDQGEKA